MKYLFLINKKKNVFHQRIFFLYTRSINFPENIGKHFVAASIHRFHQVSRDHCPSREESFIIHESKVSN